MKEKGKILLIDDQEPFYKLIKRYFLHTEYTIDYLPGPDNLDDILTENNYDLLILDVLLPNISGYDICKSVRKNMICLNADFIFVSKR
jgi:two-component system phosphate regulon response regulator OmpR